MLVSDIVPAGWRLNTAGPAPGGLVCASLDACYVTGSSATRSSGPDDFASLYFSADGGNTWSVLALPDGFSFNWFSAMSCPAARVCYGAGTIRGTPVLISTDDGGQRWHVLPIAYRIAWLTCPEVGVCSGTTYGTPSDSNSVDDIPSMNHGVAFVHTVDAGVRWTSSKLPPADAVSSLACPSSTNCVVVAYPTDQSQGPGHFSGASLVTTDAGHTWASGRLPSGFGFDYISGVSCPDSAHCMALGVIAVPNPDQCRGGPPPPGFQGCSSGGTSIVSGVVTTADGGRTWRKRALPRDVPLPMISDVSCWSPGNCWLSGEEAVPQGNNGGSGLVLGTANDGASWTKVTFTVPAGAPEDVGRDSYMAVGSIRCPGSAGCIALGVSDQGSHSTPVYTFRRPVGAPGTR